MSEKYINMTEKNCVIKFVFEQKSKKNIYKKSKKMYIRCATKFPLFVNRWLQQ